MKVLLQFSFVFAILCCTKGQNATCLLNTDDFDDLSEPIQGVEDCLKDLLSGFDSGNSSIPPLESLSLYNYTRILLSLNYSVGDEVEFTRAVRDIALASTAFNGVEVKVDANTSISTVEGIFGKAAAGDNYDAVSLRTHLGYLIASKLGRGTPKNVEDFFASLSLTQFGIFFGLARRVYTVAFVVDDTGSMGEEIAHVQRLISDFVRSGAASPSHYILASFNDPGGDDETCIKSTNNRGVLPPVFLQTECVGIPRKYDANSKADLSQLLSDVNRLTPNGGGDCPELAMTGILNALSLSSSQGHIIVLTDAGPKDSALKKNMVLLRAFELQVSIHFSFTPPLCSNGIDFYDISKATGGIVIEDLTSLDALSTYLNRFFRSDFVSVSSNPSNPISSVGDSGTCKNISVSTFVKILSLGISPTSGNSAQVEIINPSNVVETDVTISALSFYTFNDPSPGIWMVCSRDAGLTVTRADITDFDLTVQFLEYDLDTNSVYLTPYTPQNTQSGVVFVLSSKLEDLSTEHKPYLDVVDSSGNIVAKIDLVQCSSKSKQSLRGEFTIPSFSFQLSFTGFDKNNTKIVVKNPVKYEPITGVPCRDNCQNGGICVRGGTCKCPEGWMGPQCQYQCPIDVSPSLHTLRKVGTQYSSVSSLLMVWTTPDLGSCELKGFNVTVINKNAMRPNKVVQRSMLGEKVRAFIVHGLQKGNKYRIKIWMKFEGFRSKPLIVNTKL